MDKAHRIRRANEINDFPYMSIMTLFAMMFVRNFFLYREVKVYEYHNVG